MQNANLKMIRHSFPGLSDVLSQLPTVGSLKMNALGLTYLDIDDNYIHHISPLINDKDAVKPDYFGDGLVGAHISVIYPSEETSCHEIDLNQQHQFSVSNMYSAIIENKKYYVLKIKAPTLTSIRRRCGLPDKLFFKNYWIDLHITVAIVYLS